jgi:hypothetical protein
MGDIKMEGVGGKNSFAATRLGSLQHYPIQEYANNAWAFLPLFSVGEPAPKEVSTSVRTLFLHRHDDSLFGFDGYARDYAGCNILINGRRGSGKSVLANLISNAMLQDPTVRLIGFDVGGSYRKECSRFGGTQIDFKMDAPSGLNPFKILTEYPDSNDVVLNLSGFLGPLIAENGDGIVPESTQADLERKIKAYATLRPASPGLPDFLSKTQDVPGRAMLERWTEGVYENAFRETEQTRLPNSSRYTYFNLEHIHSATNKTYLRGIFGALIAHANNEMMKAGDARSKEKVRLFTRGDEVPFVTEIPGGAFYLKQLTANARKFDQGTMLIAQSLKSLEFRNAAGELDRGIIINSPIRCFFQIEGTDEDFAQNFDGATERQRTMLRNLYRGQDYRECMIQTPNSQGGFEWRLVKVHTRNEEYWEVTSSDEDNRKLFGLMRNVPGLTLKEAIGCLSLSKR